MTDRKTKLLAAIEATDDDQPRLIYADWLEERGELARANLIRRQCDQAAHAPWERRAVEARWDVEHLLARNDDAWRAELPVIDGVQWLDFERGFVSHVRVTNPATLYANADAIREASPVTKVSIDTIDERATPLPIGGILWLRTLRMLQIANSDRNIHPTRSLLDAAPHLELDNIYFDCSAVIAQRKKPLLGFTADPTHPIGGSLVTALSELGDRTNNMRELRLGTDFVDNDTGYFDDPTVRYDGAGTLANMNLAKLEVLDLARQRVTSSGLELLMPTLPRVRELDVSHCELGTMASVFHDGASLVRLVASGNPINDSGANPIWTAPRTATLESLELDTCELGPSAIAELVKSPLWQTLRVLDLSRNPLGVEGARALASAARPPQLHTLRLADCDFDQVAAAALATCPWFDQLIELDLSSNFVDPKLDLASVRVLSLASATFIGDLAAIWPHAVKVSVDEVAVALPEAAPELQELSVSGLPISIDELRSLLALPKLRKLCVSNCELDRDAIVRFLADHGPGAILMIDLRGIPFTQEELLTLARSPMARRMKLRAEAWTFPQPVRDELESLLGKDWYWNDDDPDEEEEVDED